MNRKILFRGKRIDDDEWVEGDLLQYRVLPVIFDKNKEQHEVSAETVGQFIGVIDKNGNKVFEGDKCSDGEFEYTVSWNIHFASFCLDRSGWMFTHWFGESMNPEDIEIIGNIHENKPNP